MKNRINHFCWNLAVALGLIEPPRLQPIVLRIEPTRSNPQRRH